MPGIGDLQINVRSDIAQFTAAMEKIQEILKNQGKNVEETSKRFLSLGENISKSVDFLSKAVVIYKGVELALKGISAAARSVQEAVDVVDNLGKKARALDIPIQQLSILRFTAKENGVEFDTLAGLVAKAQKNIGEAVSGGATPAAGAFKALHVQLRDSNGQVRSISDLLPVLGDRLQGVRSSAERISLASQIFGKEGGTQFVQILANVDGQFSKMLQTSGELAGNLGVIFNDDQFRKLAAYNDAVGRIGEAWLGVKVKLLTAAAPVITDLANQAALTLATVPPTATALLNAYRTSVGGGDRAGQAAADLDRIGTAVRDLLVDGSLAAGQALAVTAASALFAAGGAIGIQIAKGFKDSAFGDSRDQQLQTLLQGRSNLLQNRAQYAAFDAQALPIQSQIDALNAQSDSHPGIRGFNDQKVAELLGQLSKLRAEFNLTSQSGYQGAQNVDAAIATYDTKIKALQHELELFQAEQAAKLAATVDAAIGRAAPSIEHLRNTLTDRLHSLRDALVTVRNDFSNDFVGPPAPESDNLGRYVDAAEHLFDRLKTGLMSLRTSAATDWKQLVKIYDEASKELQAISTRGDLAAIALAGDPSQSDLANQQLRERLKLQLQQRQEVEKLVATFKGLAGTQEAGLLGALYGVQGQETKSLLVQQQTARDAAALQIKALYDPRLLLRKDLSNAQSLFDSQSLSQEDFDRYKQAIENKIKEIETGLANLGDQLRDTIKGWASDASNAFADVALGANVSFGSILRSWERTLISMTAKQYLFQPFANAIGGIVGNLFGATPTITGSGVGGAPVTVPQGNGVIQFSGQGINPLPRLSINARGNAIIDGVEKFAAGGGLRGLIRDTVIFPMRGKKIGVAGEAGVEYAADPVRMPDGNLGVRVAGGGQAQVTVNVIDQRSSGAAVETQQRQGPDGQQLIDIYVRDAVGRMAKDGSLDKLLGQGYGVRRKPISR